jgi:type I restriction enzyme M protein
MSSNQSGEGETRKNIVEADLVDCIGALPGQLFYSTRIPACLWFLARDKSGRPPAGQKQALRDRRGEVLFIDARKLCRMVDRVHRELTDEEIQKHDYVLTPGRYVGAVVEDEDDEPFHEKMHRLTAQLGEQMAEAQRLEGAIATNLAHIGYPLDEENGRDP